MTINAYPLTWPEGWKRTPRDRQRPAKFARFDQRLTLSEGLGRVLRELERMNVDRRKVIVSTDAELRLDGLPRSGQPEPKDHGAAVYWEDRRGEKRVMAIDLYDKVADNLAAVAATLDAMRAIERHGGAAILERAFTGFTALPAPDVLSKWWNVLDVPRGSPPDVILNAYRRLRSQHHPDRAGGSAEMFDRVEQAYRRATKTGSNYPENPDSSGAERGAA